MSACCAAGCLSAVYTAYIWVHAAPTCSCVLRRGIYSTQLAEISREHMAVDDKIDVLFFMFYI